MHRKEAEQSLMRPAHSAARVLPGGSEVPALIGDSIPMRALRKAIAKVAATSAPVLITGETGSGKELVARLLHDQSRRGKGPLVAVNCPALPPDLFHAEVFGYEKGAFTGAYRRNAGRIEAAEGGSLFLDEIGDLAPETQVVLLRFLQEGTYERLGSAELIRTDVRVIAATHVDLEKACREGCFRDDLYYRLRALHVNVPPLRDRGADIRLMAEHFLKEYCRQLGLRRHRFEPEALEAMSQYRWPGNVRELRHHILQAVVMCEHKHIGVRELALDPDGMDCSKNFPGQALSLREARHQAERLAIQQALCAAGGDVCAAAQRLEISRAQLYRLIHSHGLDTNGA